MVCTVFHPLVFNALKRCPHWLHSSNANSYTIFFPEYNSRWVLMALFFSQNEFAMRTPFFQVNSKLCGAAFYHIYNRGNNHENIFPQKRNYDYCMGLWWKHISPVAETYAYGLLKNHFPAAVFVKYEADLAGFKGSISDSRKDLFIDQDGKSAAENLSGLLCFTLSKTSPPAHEWTSIAARRDDLSLASRCNEHVSKPGQWRGCLPRALRYRSHHGTLAPGCEYGV